MTTPAYNNTLSVSFRGEPINSSVRLAIDIFLFLLFFYVPVQETNMNGHQDVPDYQDARTCQKYCLQGVHFSVHLLFVQIIRHQNKGLNCQAKQHCG